VDLQKQKEDHLESIRHKYGNTATGLALEITLADAWDDLIKVYENSKPI
jgi:hypothetical protein